MFSSRTNRTDSGEVAPEGKANLETSKTSGPGFEFESRTMGGNAASVVHATVCGRDRQRLDCHCVWRRFRGRGGACGVASDQRVTIDHSSKRSWEEESDPGAVDRAPAVEVRGGDVELTLEPWTACGGNGCYDGFAPDVLPDIGSPDEILVDFPASGWEFTATLQPVGEECGRRQSEPLEPTGDTTHRLVPIGPANDYEVTLFGRGPGGDVFVSFRWKTPTDGVLLTQLRLPPSSRPPLEPSPLIFTALWG
jgi:hypothetical protein